jgi:chromosome segregation protein
MRSSFRQAQSVDLLSEISSRTEEIKTAVNDMEKAVENMYPEIQTLKSKLTNYEKRVSTAEGKVSESQTKRDGFHQRVQDMRIELLNLENSRDNLTFQKKTTSDLINELTDRGKIIETEISELKTKIESLTAKSESSEAELQTAMGKIQKQRSVLDLKRAAAEESYKHIEDIRAKIKSEQQSREMILEELKQAEVDIAEFEQKILSQKDRIMEKYNMKIPDKVETPNSLEDVRDRIARFQSSIINIGPINMAVKDEHDEESKRLEMLTHQKLDLMKAEENLRETIQKIDEIARKMFKETFDEIKTNFEKLFTMFFEGGKGELSLTGDPDPLEANISIHAQPPGKRNQNLRMLSAGEKALTAIALLFSIYQVKPSPYCILDEVDAPLDDVNIKKFTRVLQQFSDETQFIVVTHNKLTMEAATQLYGVTMENRGVSKLVSVQFEA